MRGESGGFAGETFVKSGELFKQLVDLQPFQNGFLGFKNPQAVGYFGDGKAAMTLALNNVYLLQRALAADKAGSATTRSAGSPSRSCPAARAMPATRWAASPAGWSPRARRRRPPSSSSSSSRKDVQKRLAAGNFLVPVVNGAEAGLPAPSCSNIAENLARSKYHQNFYDQTLGPSVGRVVNDVSAEIAGGSMTPKDAAKAIQDAWKQGN